MISLVTGPKVGDIEIIFLTKLANFLAGRVLSCLVPESLAFSAEKLLSWDREFSQCQVNIETQPFHSMGWFPGTFLHIDNQTFQL